MFDHIGLNVKNLAASVRFYEAALAPLGYVLCSRDDSGASFGPKDSPALYLYASKGPSGAGTHVAFKAKHRNAVTGFHEAGVKGGGKDHGAPGVREDYSANYYAAFLLDPDGNNVEAVCFT